MSGAPDEGDPSLSQRTLSHPRRAAKRYTPGRLCPVSPAWQDVSGDRAERGTH